VPFIRKKIQLSSTVIYEIHLTIVLFRIIFYYFKEERTMLKRYQVLLPDWMEDNIKYYIDLYGLSFSEGIRAELCSAIIATVQLQFPEYKPDTTLEEIIDKLKKMRTRKIEKEEIKQILSKVYFEARKASEYRHSKEKEQRQSRP
jgi:hypothetical protein